MMTRRATLGTVAALAAVPVMSGCGLFGGAGETPVADRAWEVPNALDDDPAVYEHGEQLLVYSGTSLTALSVETGARQWSVPDLIGDVYVTDELAVVRTDDYRTVSAVELTTGEARKLLETDGEEVFDNIAVAGDTLLTHQPVPDVRPWVTRLTARELSSGDERWHKDIDDSLGEDFGRYLAVHAPVASPQPFAADADEPKDIVAVAPNAAVLYASNAEWDDDATVTITVDADSGDITATQPEPLLDLEYLRALITDDGVLITQRFHDRKRKCQYIVDVTDGDDTHSTVFSAYSVIDLDECAESDRAPWVSGKHLCGTDEKGYPQLVELATGEVVWRDAKVPGEVFGCVGRVVVRAREGLDEGQIVGVDTQSGETLWQREIGENEGRYARVIHDGLLIDAGRTNVFAVDPATGDRIWKVSEARGVGFDILGVGTGRVYVESDGTLIAVNLDRE